MGPQGANFISIYTMDYNNHLTPYGSQVYIYDNYSSYQVQNALKHEYFMETTVIDIEQILLTLYNPNNPFSQNGKRTHSSCYHLLNLLFQLTRSLELEKVSLFH
ncbi:hypothetical protein QFZ77_000169 [Paenibacillus sp. V4I3]|nr:hypothetical protein [Paenibacillus sp. V4I3]MDQ0885179.1 hypothetical protein [Paenibacillus sp. V4I9]